MADFTSTRTHVVLAANGGFVAATLAEAKTVRAAEAHASRRERESLTKAAVRAFGAPVVDVARPTPGQPLLLTVGEAKALAFRLSRSQTRNRIANGNGQRRRRRA